MEMRHVVPLLADYVIRSVGLMACADFTTAFVWSAAVGVGAAISRFRAAGKRRHAVLVLKSCLPVGLLPWAFSR